MTTSTEPTSTTPTVFDSTGRNLGHPNSSIRAAYCAIQRRTSAERVYEAGSLRLRHPRVDGCQAVLVNTAGGVAAGDRLDLDIAVGPNASVTLTSAAAEKIYRSEGPLTTIATKLALAVASHAVWVPQETIVFDGANLHRHFEVDLAEDAAFAAAEMVIFGRPAFGERKIFGSFRDSWRVRRAGHLVFADETRLEGPIGATLARAAVGKGMSAVALILMAIPDVVSRLDAVRTAIETCCQGGTMEGGASIKDGIIVARFVAGSSEVLRQAVSHVLAVGGGIVVPRVWR